jgi:2-keto-3-deoxy-L-rhamnonate aldolase RhmA
MMPHMGFRSASIAQVSEVGNSLLSTVVVMIESPEAVGNVDAIAAVEGVDVILIGTNDLSIELGVPGDFDHPSFIESVVKIAAAVKKHQKIFGVAGIYNRPDILHRFIHEYGARFVVGHVDLPLLAKATAETAAELQKLEAAEEYNLIVPAL